MSGRSEEGEGATRRARPCVSRREGFEPRREAEPKSRVRVLHFGGISVREAWRLLPGGGRQ